MSLVQPSSVRAKKAIRTVGQNYQAWSLLAFLSIVMVGGIGWRLGYLQLAEAEKHNLQAESNRIRLIPKLPVRGNIFDRQGRLLASSRLSHSVFLWPRVAKRDDWFQTRQRLSQILTIPEAEIQKLIDKQGRNVNTLVPIARSLTPAQITALAELSSDRDGLEVDIEAVRNYPNKDIAAHILGYTGEITDKELGELRSQGYRLGDVIGQMGVEAAFEKELRGEWGGFQIEVDGSGKAIRALGSKRARPGQDLQLTIDLNVQKAAEAALGNRKGAIVAINPNTGEVLALVSRPSFDPNIFSSRISPKIWKELQSKDHPFVNRALRGFPPASTFKIVTATAGIESGKFSPKSVLQTYGSLNIGGTVFRDWNGAGFGPLGFAGALQWSSDTFFYQIGKGVGGPTLIDWTRKYGFGKKTGIELKSEESKGLVADDTWKQKNLKLAWSVGDTVNMSIGQGFLQASPLQVAVMFSVPANGGYLVKPHLLKSKEPVSKWRKSLNIKPETLKVLRQGLRAVVNAGTGKALNSPTIPPASGKSGTAEAPPGANHIWFGGYAPSDKPEIVVVAFGEHEGKDGGGGKIAAPMVLRVMEAYFNAKKPPAKPVK
ncbi:penicillin-binding protein 2 [Merismopedia glauca]|uniref:Penicillin-binding protein 2 n=1 Tax=Merismopedia glauca CCAP 1448/3 TaxID=1296344 RepID=A0A2T1C9Q5_9CYAN|nr:penicillin-binding protein 2 [Merismopedia glauca]PSB04898.1 penicillin-binding protein 2 [Merismopedia glauca CCAP 1448/3]